ncbi:RIO1 family protein [Dictyocaulus viviparus]|uniref:Serine/threonine-protein kinase RIO1 n=1 Tax=Dictyocaulus viviparus TaxID=29172 RepID=A0A0D8XLF7_DICVI|nr:RIO1 family protein [Dictyocaulus viviparus]
MKKVANFDIDAGVTEIIDSEIALSNEHGFCTVDIKHDYEEIGSDPGDFTEEVGDFTKKYNAFRNNICGPNSQYTYRAVQSVVESTTDAAAEKKRKRIKDRADRATVEQVLDPRTKLILFRLLQRGILSNIHGCISTGKEANVYHAVNGNTSYAVKVYKTSILTFKDRDRYVSGEYRYRRGYCKRNPRKMVALWAEKEMRNLLRMHEAGLPVPKPFLLKGHVVMMEFIGHDGWPAPLLKDAALNTELLTLFLIELLLCGRFAVLATGSSYADAVSYLNFSIPILPTYKLFELIVDPLIRDDDIDRWLEMRTHDVLDDMLFMSAFIPLKLDHVLHFERDSQLLKAGKEANNPFQNIVSKVDIAGNGFVKEDASITKSLYQDENLKNTGDGKQDRKIVDSGKYYRDKCETPEQRKARKQVVKEEKRESRRTKIPKHVKKRAHRQHMK